MTIRIGRGIIDVIDEKLREKAIELADRMNNYINNNEDTEMIWYNKHEGRFVQSMGWSSQNVFTDYVADIVEEAVTEAGFEIDYTYDDYEQFWEAVDDLENWINDKLNDYWYIYSDGETESYILERQWDDLDDIPEELHDLIDWDTVPEEQRN
jgi:hypothetical protein